MASLRPPSTSPSPSPAPVATSPNRPPPINARASLGPARSTSGSNPTGNLASPRPGGILGTGRPTSEFNPGNGAAIFQTPESEAIDQWFENLQNYEATLEEMAAASLDVNFKEELSAIEQWFRVLSEAERTAALYSLLQHSTQVQIRFFITVLQQMARSDPMTALLSPAQGGSMQAQMEAKLATLKSPGTSLKTPASPAARNFSNGAQRASLGNELSSSFLSPESANATAANADAAAILAQQRANLQAKASHRISAPGTLLNASSSAVWGAPSSQLGQLAEQGATTTEDAALPSPAPVGSARPKSMAIDALSMRSPRPADLDDQLSPTEKLNWASMVNTPMVPMFAENTSQNNLTAAAMKLNDWSKPNNSVNLADPKQFRRTSKTLTRQGDTGNKNSGVYGDDGNLIVSGVSQPGSTSRNVSGNAGGSTRSTSGGNNNFLAGGQGWSGAGARSPALSNVSPGRFGNDDGNIGGFGGFPLANGLGSPSLGLPMMGLGGMPGMAGFNMLNMANMANFNAMAGINPEAYLAMLAASGAYGPAGMFNNLQPGMNMRGGSKGRSASGKSANGRDSGSKDKDDEVDISMLNDIPSWLRSLRLHKYTPNFEGMSWKDMVLMDEAALEAKGVAALGARRKMLKTFEGVRNKMGIEHPPGTVPTTAA